MHSADAAVTTVNVYQLVINGVTEVLCTLATISSSLRQLYFYHWSSITPDCSSSNSGTRPPNLASPRSRRQAGHGSLTTGVASCAVLLPIWASLRSYPLVAHIFPLDIGCYINACILICIHCEQILTVLRVYAVVDSLLYNIQGTYKLGYFWASFSEVFGREFVHGSINPADHCSQLGLLSYNCDGRDGYYCWLANACVSVFVVLRIIVSLSNFSGSMLICKLYVYPSSFLPRNFFTSSF